jgi:hypothetical protein
LSVWKFAAVFACALVAAAHSQVPTGRFRYVASEHQFLALQQVFQIFIAA